MPLHLDSEPHRFSGSGVVCDERAFNPEQARDLRAAFSDACMRLAIPPEDAAGREKLAKIMLALVRTRPTSAHAVVDDALIWFTRERHVFAPAARVPVREVRKRDVVAFFTRTPIGLPQALQGLLGRNACTDGRPRALLPLAGEGLAGTGADEGLGEAHPPGDGDGISVVGAAAPCPAPSSALRSRAASPVPGDGSHPAFV